MISPASVGRLREVQDMLRALVEDLDDQAYRTQFHADLSPLGWHLGHCTFIENYWLREVVLGDDRLTASWAHYYIPANSPKPQRGPALPGKEQLLDAARRQQSQNLRLCSKINGHEASGPLQARLLKDDYLIRFLVQHHAQHIETMHMACAQRALKHKYKGFSPNQRLVSSQVGHDYKTVDAGRYRIGGESPEAFDNEVPAHWVERDAYQIGARPVSNAQYLRFIEEDGYRTRRHWSVAGWTWLQRTGCDRPEHWRQDAQLQWFGVDHQGPYALPQGDPVSGISYHEARAFAAWAGARLPHEYEWEIGCRAGLLSRTGHVWEWCDNTLHPYAGFRPFPYDEYSLPWFDDAHYVLRGGSIYTLADVRRASFRNFYTPEKRHIFAGLRLAL